MLSAVRSEAVTTVLADAGPCSNVPDVCWGVFVCQDTGDLDVREVWRARNVCRPAGTSLRHWRRARPLLDIGQGLEDRPVVGQFRDNSFWFTDHVKESAKFGMLISKCVEVFQDQKSAVYFLFTGRRKVQDLHEPRTWSPASQPGHT